MRYRTAALGRRVPRMIAHSSKASHVSRLLAAAIVAAATTLAAVPAEAFVVYNRTGHEIRVQVQAPGETATWSAVVPPFQERGCNWADGAACGNPDGQRTSLLIVQIDGALDFQCQVRMQAGGSVEFKEADRSPLGIATPALYCQSNLVEPADTIGDYSPFGYDYSPIGYREIEMWREVNFLATADPQYWHTPPDHDAGVAALDIQADRILAHMDMRVLADKSYRGILVAGDLTQDSFQFQFDRYEAFTSPVSRFMFDGLGNHDLMNTSCDGIHPRAVCSERIVRTIRDRPRAAVTTKFKPFPHYSWDWHDVHFVQLNLFPGNSPGPFEPEKDPMAALAFLSSDLAVHVGTSGRPVVLTHHYGFDKFSMGKDSKAEEWWSDDQRKAYWDVIAPYNVIAIITGHYHYNAFSDFPFIEWKRPAGTTLGPPKIFTFIAGAARGDGPLGPGTYADVRINGNWMGVFKKDAEGNQSGIDSDGTSKDYATRGVYFGPPTADINPVAPLACHSATPRTVDFVSASSDPGTAAIPPDGPVTLAWSTNCPGATLTDPTSSTAHLNLPGGGGCDQACSVTVTATNDWGRKSSFTRPVPFIGTPPNGAVFLNQGDIVDEGGQLTFTAQGYPTQGQEVTMQNLKCGTDAPTSITPDSLPNFAVNIVFQCAFPDGPAVVPVTAVMADIDGSSTHVAYVTVNNRAPSLTFFDAPASAGWDSVVLAIEGSDPGQDTLTATLEWSDGYVKTIPLNGRTTATRTAAPGVHTVRVFVTDSDGAVSAAMVKTITVLGHAPNVILSGPARVSIGQTVTYRLRYHDPDGGIPSVSNVSCGQGGTAEIFPPFFASDDYWTNVRCTYSGPSGNTEFRATVTDDEGIAAPIQLALTVGSAPTGVMNGDPATTVPEGWVAVYAIVGAATDGDAVSIESVSCGAAGNLVGPVVDTDPGPDVSAQMSCSYPDGLAASQVVVSLRDLDGTTTLTRTVTIRNIAPSIALMTGLPGSFGPGQSAALSFVVNELGADEVTATVTWGDGSSSTTTGVGTKQLTHAWAAPGVYPVTITVVDDDGAMTFSTTTATIADVTAPVFTFVPPGVTMTQESAAGAVHQIGAASAVDNTDPAPVITVSGVPPNNLFPVGTTTITFTAVDKWGNHATATSTVTVNHNTPAGSGPIDVADSATVAFAGVVTPGFTSASPIDPETAGPLSNAFVSALFAFEIATTAAVTAPITTCFTVGNQVDPDTFAALRILHGEGGLLVDRTVLAPHANAPDYETRRICAETTSLSPFVAAVLDTTAPVLNLLTPAPVTATSVAGARVTFTAGAEDDHTPALTPTCAPASGAMFPIGTTTVRCSATDAAGNTTAGTFPVIVNDVTTPGEMTGDGFIRADKTRYEFAFLVREKASGYERGRFSLRIEEERRDKKGKRADRDDRFTARAVDFVAFSDDPTVRPGRQRRPQVDTVVFSGTGSMNGTAGYRYEATAKDEGEPGRHRESVRITIWSPSGAVVASVDGVIDGGNVQSKRIHR